jgi:hypothetical protein
MRLYEQNKIEIREKHLNFQIWMELLLLDRKKARADVKGRPWV